VAVDGAFEDWGEVTVEYRDTIGDTAHRDYPGYGGLHYTNTSGRNDIVTSKVAVDDSHVYFYAATAETLTPHTGNHWMLLFADTDQNSSTGWCGYDYMINKAISDSTTTLMRYEAGAWVAVAELPYRYAGKQLEIAVPREALGLAGDAFTFDFHWCDNPVELLDAISLCTDGDSAPNRRFNYRCTWSR
jgi:hypothetical protein